MKLTTVLFDAGNVLYHRPRRGARFAAFLAEQGLPPVSRSYPRWVALKRQAHAGKISEEEYHDALLDLCGVHSPTTRHQGRRILHDDERDIVYFDGVAETLHRLKAAGLRLGVVTNTSISTNEKLDWFRLAGFDSVWDSFATSCELKVCKPDPQIYLVALNPLGVRPEEAIFVGHAAIELEGAKALGMTTIAFNRDDETVTADHIIDKFPELLDLLALRCEQCTQVPGTCEQPTN